MDGMRTSIIAAVVALIVGAGGAYFYMQRQTSELSDQVSTLQTLLADCKSKGG